MSNYGALSHPVFSEGHDRDKRPQRLAGGRGIFHALIRDAVPRCTRYSTLTSAPDPPRYDPVHLGIRGFDHLSTSPHGITCSTSGEEQLPPRRPLLALASTREKLICFIAPCGVRWMCRSYP